MILMIVSVVLFLMFRHLLGQVSSKQFETAINERKWQRVGSLLSELKDALDSQKLVGVIEHACKTVDCRDFQRYILPHVDDDLLSKCSTEQLDSLLKTATTPGLWHMVHKVLTAGCSHEKRAWAIEQASVTAGYKNFNDYILSHVHDDFLSECSIEQLEGLLTTATTRSLILWHMVQKLLTAGGSHEKRVWVIEQACKTVDRERFGHYVDNDFLSHCSTEQLDSLLKTATTRGLWHMVHKVLTAGCSHEKRAWAIEQACERARYKNFNDYILSHVHADFMSHCSTEQLNSLLKTATKRGLWHMVQKVLTVGCSHEKCAWAIEKACETAGYKNFNDNILPHVHDDFLSHCSTEQLDSLLTTATTRGLWHMVHKMLTAGCNEKRAWAIEQACERARYKNFNDNILPHVHDDFLSQCSTEQLNSLLTTATTRGLWHMVHKVLKAGGSHEKHAWVIEQACKTAGYKNFEDYILPFVVGEFLSQCSTQQLGTLLTTATTRRLWHVVLKALMARGSHQMLAWAFEQACKTVDREGFGNYILPYLNDFLSQCSSEQLDALLTTATTQRLWHVVHTLLETVGSHETRAWVIEHACETAGYKTFKDYILSHVHDDFLSHCSTEQLDSLLTTATTRGLWHMVNTLLMAGSSHEKRLLTIEQAYKTAKKSDFERYILPLVDDEFLSQCSTVQLDTLLVRATKWSLWQMVHKVLKAVENHGKRAFVMEQACKTADVHSFESYMLSSVDGEFLSQCSTEQLDTLLTTATTRGLWHMVHIMLKAVRSHEKRVWVFEQACKTSENRSESYLRLEQSYPWRSFFGTHDDFNCYILPHVDDDFLSNCTTEQLDGLLTTATTQGLWYMVCKVLNVVDSHEKRLWVIEQACKTANYKDFERCILPFVDDDFLSHCSTAQMDTFLSTAKTLGLRHMIDIVTKAVDTHKERAWVIEQACKRADHQDFKDYILPLINGHILSHCSTEQLDILLTAATTWDLWHVVHKVLLARDTPKKFRWVTEACKTVGYKDFMEYILPHCSKEQMEFALEQFVSRGEWECVVELLKRGISGTFKIKVLSEACKGCTYTSVMEWIDLQLGDLGAKLLINSLPSNQLSSEAQSVAVRFALQQRKWDVISQACLSQVWEQARRHLFREAVNQRQWTVVKKRADHTLYDDERWWALEEAYKQKQWDVMLQLADHGLTEIELMRVRYRLAKHADWDVVLRMIGRGVDITELREVVESAAVSRKTAADEAKRHALALRWKELRQLEEKLTRLEDQLTIAISGRRFKLPLNVQQWNTVLFHLHRHPGTFTRASSHYQPRKPVGEFLLQRAIEQRRWHIVMHLVTLGMDTEKLNSLLTDMIRRRQWGVCRVLLKQGVSVLSCLNALPVFMENNQWALVATVMEFIEDDALKRQVEQLALEKTVGSLVWQCVSAMCHYGMCVGDEVRLHVMHQAMERREGSVVGECISTMQHYRLSVKEREKQFQQAISRGVLQAVKPLVEEKRETEFQHRDATLLAAIEQRQWDVVDCCQLQGADIDMKDKRGETPLNREARNGEWKAVEELAVRGADPNVLDKDGCSVLNRAIHVHEWDIVRLLIVCLGNIHKSARYEPDYELDYESRYHSDSESENESPLLSKGEVPTPLQLLIDKRQGEIIEHTLIWSPDQSKGVNDEGETTLHAVVLDKKPELLYYQIVRGVNPLELTKGGHSVLLYAVGNEHCPQKMVAECIRLGFSTHQPRLIRKTAVDVESVAYCVLYRSYQDITSPFLLAVLRGMPVIAHMLYESGSCSYAELLQLFTMLLDCSDPHSETGRRFVEEMQPGASDQRQQRYETFMNTLTTFLPYLREMASTPRSLVSTCRMVISHSLTVHRRRERDVHELVLTDRMKNYLLFSDLTDPDYQWFLYGRLPPLTTH